MRRRRRDDDLNFGGYRATKGWGMLIPIVVIAILLVIVVVMLISTSIKDVEANASIDKDNLEETDDGQVVEAIIESESVSEKSGVTETVEEQVTPQLLLADGANEISEKSFGIDVAKYQGTIDWKQVADSGIEFAMVRVGYRTVETGEIVADTNARYNMQEAQANGIKLGAYFFSTAVTEEEAVAEADWVADYIAQYQITYPVAYNCEGFDAPESRQYSLTQSERTDVAIAFLNRIYERGYTPMFYAAKNEIEADAKWDTSRLQQSYKLWVAWYSDYLTPMDEGADTYTDGYAMWQYTSQGNVAGIPEAVDMNVAYFSYEGTAAAKSDVTPESASADVEALMDFTEVNETITAKEKTNLRDVPSQGSDSTVKAILANGETATRTGVSDSGWSRIIYNGATYYAVSSYLTTDLNYKAPSAGGAVAEDDDGVKTEFSPVNDSVTAKIEVNLRTLPSVTNPDATVVAVLHNGEVVTRTGINEEYGWSRVEYNGQILYCISSYLTGVQ